MNQENLKFLQDRLFYLGTEKRLYPELEKNIAEGKPEFKLPYSNHYDKDKLSADLHFRKSDTQDMYFLNRYDATLQKPGQESRSQTFYLDNGKGVTMKEAFNLLDGRSVNKELKNKEGVVYNAWIKLDLNNKDEKGNAKMLQYHKNYGYDLPTELFKLPLPNMTSESFNQMVSSLERGNIQKIKLPEEIIGAVTPILINANPQFKTLDISDEDGRPLSKTEKNDLHALAEMRKNEFDKGISNGATKIMSAPDLRVENKVSGSEMNMVRDQKPEKTIPEKKTEKSETSNQKQEQKNPAKATKKEKLESLLPKKHSGQKKGMVI
jgi:hypothetical protein